MRASSGFGLGTDLAVAAILGLIACNPSAGSPSRSAEPAGPLGQAVVIRIDPTSGDLRSVVQVPRGSRMMATAAGQLWVLNGADRTLSRIDPVSEQVTSVDIGEPAGLTGDGNALWVAVDGNRLVRIDGSTGAELKSLQVADDRLFALGDAGFPAVGGGYLWLTVPELGVQSGPQELWQLDPTSGALVTRWPIGVNPIAPLAEGDHLWIVTRGGSGQLSRVDMESGRSSSVKVAAYPERLASGLGSVWVGHRSGEVWRIEPETGDALAKIEIDGLARGIDIGGDLVWVATNTTLLGIDPSTNQVIRSTDLTDGKPAAAEVWTLVYVAGSVWLTVD